MSRTLRDLSAPAIASLGALLAFSPGLYGGFVWDDHLVLETNAFYHAPLQTSLPWIFTSFYLGPYQPLSWLSYALDHAVWGPGPFGFHFTNLLLHAVNAGLVSRLFLMLFRREAGAPGPARGMDASYWAAALAGLLFAVHPLRAESVCWVTERRDVLSCFFCLWALLLYCRSRGPWPWSWIFFGLGLLSKASVLGLAAVFLILDIHPLKRLPGRIRLWREAPYQRILFEKIPYALLAVAAGVTAWVGQSSTGALSEGSGLGFFHRAALASFSLAYYPLKTILPVGLVPLLERPRHLDPLDWRFLAAGAAVAGISMVLWFSRRRWPGLLAAWACYAAMILPVSGFIPFGFQLAADRYSYLACLPFSMAGSGALLILASSKGLARHLAFGSGLAVVMILTGLSRGQARIWADDESLWTYCIQVKPEQSYPLNYLGIVRLNQERFPEAESLFRQSLQKDPSSAAVHMHLANALIGQGRAAEAEAPMRQALRISPELNQARVGLAWILLHLGSREEALWQLNHVLRLDPEDHQARELMKEFSKS